MLIVNVVFGGLCNQIHCPNNFYRIRTSSCFTREHNRTRSIINCIGNVGNFCSGRSGICNHGFQHLRCSNDLLACLIALPNQFFLNCRNLFKWNFYAKVTTSNHNAICGFQNFVNVLYAFQIFNLCDNPDIEPTKAMRIFSQIINICGRADETCCDEIKSHLRTKFQVVPVFFAQIRHRKCNAWNIDPLIIREHTAVND